jgi:putative ABC transport system permease protein
MLSDLLIRLRALFRRNAVESELDDELRFHFDQQVEKFVQSGMPVAEARRRARLEFGGSDQIKEECREARGVRFLETLWQDLHYGVRMLRKNPGFAITAVLILALAIGANTSFFSALYGLLFRSLPFAHPDRLMTVWSLSSSPQLKHFPFVNSSAPDYYDWAKQNTVFQGLAAMNYQNFNLTGAGEPLAVTGFAVTENFFDVLQKPPVVGRGFLPGEIGPGKADVVILSHSLWKRAFGGRPDILGRSVTLDHRVYTVVGVAPPDANFREDFRGEFYLPLDVDPVQKRGARSLEVIGRLKPGVTEAQALTEMRTIAARLAERYPDTNKDWSVRLIPLREHLFGDLRWPIGVLYAAAALLILIACANLANVLMVRGMARSSEMAIRSALGAGRLRLCRQMLTESLLLSLLGGALGILLSWWGVDLMRVMVSVLQRSSGITGTAHITLSPWSLAFTMALSFGATLLFGLFPSWQASQTRSADALRGAAHSVGEDRGRHRLSRFLVVGEISLSFVLLAGFFLMFRSLDHLSHTSLGYSSSQVLTLELSLPSTPEYQESRSRAAFCHYVLNRMQATPGVLSAASVNQHPLSAPHNLMPFEIAGRSITTPGDHPIAEPRTISTDYFRTMGISLLRGRDFTRTDTNGVIVDQELVRQYFPGENPIGRQISLPGGYVVKIVGVVGSIQPPKLTDKLPRPHMYLSIDAYCLPDITFMVRTRGDPMALAGAMRQAIWAVDRNLPIPNIQPMQNLVQDRLSMPRLIATISGLFAAAALVLTMLGVYGVMAYAVHRQTREIGVRTAFGAERSDILRMVLRKGMAMIGIGSAVGLVAALILCRVLSSLLYETSPADPVAYGVVIVVVAATGLLACYVPARRATKLDPMAALRCE